jgi:AcrR family transcriptional regulator
MARAGAKRRVGIGGSTGAEETRRALVAGAIDALREEGFSGASARAIATRAGCNQGLVFYHFGSVTNLLLAALDEVSATRLARYRSDAGYISVLAEMIAGAASTPGLGAEVAARIAPWREFATAAVRDTLADSPLGQVLAPAEVAHGIVALYLGLEMLAHLDGDRSAALGLFDRAGRLAGPLSAFGAVSTKEGT